MTFSDIARLSIADPAELIETVPYLLGFHPAESLVLLGLHRASSTQMQRVTVAMRVDLSDQPLRAGELSHLVHALQQSDSTDVLCIIFTDDFEGNPHQNHRLRRWQQLVSSELVDGGLHLLDVLLASEFRWWSLSCESPACCPPFGSPRNAGAAVAAAEATVAGLVALPDRSSLHSLLDGVPSAQRESMRALILEAMDSSAQGAPAHIAEFVAAADRVHHGEVAAPTTSPRPANQIPADELARYAAWLQNIDVRDELWMAIDDGSLDATSLLQELLTRVPAPFNAPALFLFGWSRWREGNGTLASMAAERALDADDSYSAARLLLGALQSGLDPRRTPCLRAGEPL